MTLYNSKSSHKNPAIHAKNSQVKGLWGEEGGREGEGDCNNCYILKESIQNMSSSMTGKHSRMCNSKDMLKNQIAFVVSPCTEKNQAYSSTVAVDLHILCHHSEDSSLVYI